MSLLTGCTTTQIRPVTLPAPFKPSTETIRWVEINQAPDYVVNDLVDATALGEIIEQTSNNDPIKRTSWKWLSILDYAWSGVKAIFGWTIGLFV